MTNLEPDTSTPERDAQRGEQAGAGPRTSLAALLATGDLDGAAALLGTTSWTNLSNVLATLPDNDRITAYRLLSPETAMQVFDECTATEQTALLGARGDLPHNQSTT